MRNDTKQLLNAKFRGPLLSAILIFALLLDAILLLMGAAGNDSLIEAAFSGEGAKSAASFAILCLIVIGMGACAVGCVLALAKKQIPLSSAGAALICHALTTVLSATFDIYGAMGLLMTVLNLLILLAGCGYCLLCLLSGPDRKSRTPGRFRGLILLFGLLSMVLTLSLFFLPFCTLTVNGEPLDVIPMDAVFGDSGRVEGAVIFAVLAVFAVAEFVLILRALENASGQDSIFAAKIHQAVTLSAVTTGLYFTAGAVYCTAIRKTAEITYSSLLPFMGMAVLIVCYALLVRRINRDLPEEGLRRGRFAVRLEFFLYGTALSLLTVGACMVDIVKVTLKEPELTEILKVNGYQLLSKVSSAGDGFRTAAFLLVIVLSLTVALFLCSLASLIIRSELFHKFALAQCIAGTAACMFVGLIGKYYEIVQRINQQTVVELLEETVGNPGIRLVYSVKSASFYWFLAAMGVAVIALLRKPYTRIIREGASEPSAPTDSAANLPAAVGAPDAPAGFDPCPAFTELDRKIDQFAAKAREDAEFSFGNPTLATLVQYVVSYARDSRLHLSYSVQDIAAFVAGMGASRLTILQGMSGTGKTSLPKIFCEALMSCCEIIEVESSWRDKHELLGYYNEFSKTYTPKKFTQALYKARLNPDQLTLIVLDELNLSRIEYYFSDFLSLMENEEDRREIKLLNVGLCRTVEGRRIPYRGLTEGHTLKIPSNVWFVGTANRDESTFEISDKVYDRAHTMNFNKRAPKVTGYRDPLHPRRISAGDFTRLLREADRSMHFDLDECAAVRELEDLLAPYNISFGNRVAGQIETFVRIYCACFPGSPNVREEALETILLSKLVAKLEYRTVVDKEGLAESMRRLNLNRCADFVMRLGED